MTPDKYAVSKIDKSFDLKGFSSGVDQIDTFLHQFALGNERKNLSRTWIMHEVGQTKVAGYYTLSSASVLSEEIGEILSFSLPRYSIPCTRIGKLGVDSSLQNQGLGGFLLADALKRCKQASHTVASLLVVNSGRKQHIRGGRKLHTPPPLS